MKPIPIDSVDAVRSAGGLDLEEATVEMRKADRADRKRHQERVKGKHKVTITLALSTSNESMCFLANGGLSTSSI